MLKIFDGRAICHVALCVGSFRNGCNIDLSSNNDELKKNYGKYHQKRLLLPIIMS